MISSNILGLIVGIPNICVKIDCHLFIHIVGEVCLFIFDRIPICFNASIVFQNLYMKIHVVQKVTKNRIVNV